MTFFYDINRRLADLDQIKPTLNESQHVDEKYMGFDKTVAAIKKGGSADDPEAVAASIGRKKYGKERFQKAAAAGKKLGEQQGVAEGWDPDTKRLEQDVRDALDNGDDYTAKQYVKMAPTPEAKKYLLNIIKQAMYIDDLGGETDWKGVAEGSKELEDEFAAMLTRMGQSFRRGPTQRRPESPPRDYSADIAALPEMEAKLADMIDRYKKLGGSSWQYADREQNLTDREREARSLGRDIDGLAARIDFLKRKAQQAGNQEQLDEKMYFDPATGQTTDRTFKPPVGGFRPPMAQSAPVDNTQFKADVDRAKSGLTMKPGDPTVYSRERGLGPTMAADRLAKRGVDIPGLVGNRINPAALDADFGMYEDDVGEGNEFSGALAKARATGQKEFEVDGKTYSVTEGRVEKTTKGVRHHGTYGTDYQGQDDDESGDDNEGTKKRKKHVQHDQVGRPAAPKHTYDAPFGTVKIPAWKGPKTVHKIGDNEPGKEAPRRGRPKKVQEQDDMVDMVDRGEYDREGAMAHDQLRTVVDAAKELRSILKADENLPEWVQSKITKALDYIDTARDYMKSQKSNETEPVNEKAVSRAQQQAAGIALAAKRRGQKPSGGGASAEMSKMPTKELKKFASTKHKGLPKHQDDEVKETTTSGSVAVSDTAEPKKSKGKSSVSFGKGIYDSWNRELEQMISEGMNVTVTQNTSETGELDKSITINATGDDADRLAELLNLAGMHNDHEDHSRPTCNQEPYGCAEIVDENSPDWPTDTEYNQDSLQYSGGLNRPKTTGQTTVPVIASQLDRQMSESNELDYIKKMLG